VPVYSTLNCHNEEVGRLIFFTGSTALPDTLSGVPTHCRLPRRGNFVVGLSVAEMLEEVDFVNLILKQDV
jgi:hypothetical protein